MKRNRKESVGKRREKEKIGGSKYISERTRRKEIVGKRKRDECDG